MEEEEERRARFARVEFHGTPFRVQGAMAAIAKRSAKRRRKEIARMRVHFQYVAASEKKRGVVSDGRPNSSVRAPHCAAFKATQTRSSPSSHTRTSRSSSPDPVMAPCGSGTSRPARSSAHSPDTGAVSLALRWTQRADASPRQG